MEKRKDIDMLRFYGGDIHQKNKEGEYVITNNLVSELKFIMWKYRLFEWFDIIYSKKNEKIYNMTKKE